jgi:hypothetical protein
MVQDRIKVLTFHQQGVGLGLANEAIFSSICIGGAFVVVKSGLHVKTAIFKVKRLTSLDLMLRTTE